MQIISIYNTKHALTSGIIKQNVEVVTQSTVKIIPEQNHLLWAARSTFLHGEGRDWHRTLEGAVKRAQKMKAAKLTALDRQIKRIEKMEF